MKLVLIEWRDAHSRNTPGWKLLDDLDGQGRPLLIRSVGWLLTRTRGKGGATTVVPHVSGEQNRDTVLAGNGEITIPNSSIVSMKVLKK